jgi:hypothetical protein
MSFLGITNVAVNVYVYLFDYEWARADLGIPDNFDVMAMIAIGRKGPKENLPPQLHEREQPNDRKPLKEIVMEGQFRQ